MDLKKYKDLLLAIEEAFKYNALAAVIGEIRDLNLTELLRLRLVGEERKVTGFLHQVPPWSRGLCYL